MSESMVERVARAMMAVTAKLPAQIDGPEFPILSGDPDFDDLPLDASQGTVDDPITQEAVLKLARAAIEAMREPTEAMQRQGFRKNRHVNENTCDRPTCIAAVTMPADGAWRAMIDEALQ